jgi:signal peptidase I
MTVPLPHDPLPETPKPATPRRLPWWRDLIETILPAVVIVLAINLFLAQPRVVYSISMEPNLHEKQRVIIDRISYRFRAPQRGEIVVIDLPERRPEPPLIKRAIGLPGETIEIKAGAVYINGQKLDEPYLNQITPGTMPPQVVPEAHLFVLGDNRCCSNDSRYLGMMPYDALLGRAWMRYWPPADITFFK